MNTPDNPPASQLWERQPDEPPAWFARFQSFLLMGPGRSLLGAYKRETQLHPPKARKGLKRLEDSQPKAVPAIWRNAARDWYWEERAGAWEDHVSAQAREDWKARAEEQREQAFDAGRTLLTVAAGMANRYAESLTVDPVTRRPMFSGMADGLEILRVSTAVQRLHTLAFGGGEVLASLIRKIDFDRLSTEQLDAISGAKSSEDLLLALINGSPIGGFGEGESDEGEA